MSADAQAQEWCDEDICCYEDSGSCYANKTHFYAKIFGNANFLSHNHIAGNKVKYDTGYIIAASLGYNWCYGLRLEGEYAYRRNGIKKIHFIEEGFSEHGNFQTCSYMANLLWDFPLSSWGCFCWDLQPFVGAGIGYDSQHLHSSNSRIVFNERTHHFSWQILTGLAYPLFCNTEITLEYRYHQGGCNFRNQSIGIGFVYNFDL